MLGCLTTAAQLSYDVLVCTGICLQDQGRYEELVAQNHVAVADTGDEDWREVEEGQLHDKVILYRFARKNLMNIRPFLCPKSLIS